MKHIPGKWTSQPGLKSIQIVSSDQLIADIYGPGYGATKESQTSNARLIAAAPEMLEALKNIMEKLENFATDNWSEVGLKYSDVQKAYNIISKAEGR